jgi:hypothetical protein
LPLSGAGSARQGCVRDYVPEGYQGYLRLPLDGADGEGLPLRQWLGSVRDVLARYTGTPDRCWFSLWDGWPLPQWWRESAPTFHLPHREHLLFAGGLDDLLVIAGEFACAGVEYRNGSCVEPSLWWPQDRAWVAAGEVALDDPITIED